MQYTVVIRINDRTQTFVDRLRCGFTKNQARYLAYALNSTFASQGLNWFAAVDVQEED